ncbi:MAG: GIY-YIG nuclease family protein [Thermoflavifilum sp.]|uniref:GIY-YIG nuclease family protein n=1 Tax=Thermoflavifilum sp. TaxID=1968839 RepID=UPI0018A48C68|nr:GIY-YIG nuclease family protein [Thermoflavifilum sp.]QOR76115.1 MAG: GIY-YIG nuclease family protein [Thermoflavifilum sp.]QOR76116.1 MAG: GIY-YIG nuclease family protein [Thermoflavifilum sp.]QOR76117.1 MAG: GIY-YIG nuclease family protein [Thermoflavifilum sp.]
MPFFVYILQSHKDGSFYVGYTQNYILRLQQHNLGRSRYTSHKRPWSLIYVEQLPSKSAAIIRERKLKHNKKDYFLWLAAQPTNLIRKH